MKQNLCQAHQNSTLDDSVPRCPRNVRKLFSVPYISTFILTSASCVKVSAHASEKKIIYQVCLEEISLSSTMTQLFEVYQPRSTIDLNKRWTFFVAWCKCVSVQKENSWKSISCIKTILSTGFHGCPYSTFRIKRLDWFPCHFMTIYRRSLRSFWRGLFIYLPVLHFKNKKRGLNTKNAPSEFHNASKTQWHQISIFC